MPGTMEVSWCIDLGHPEFRLCPHARHRVLVLHQWDVVLSSHQGGAINYLVDPC